MRISDWSSDVCYSDLIGYMMQKDLLFPWRTVLQNVLLGLKVRGVNEREAIDTAREYLSTFGLSGFENAYPKTLSGGMRQRSEEHTSELQSLMRISYAVFCLTKNILSILPFFTTLLIPYYNTLSH